MFFSRKTISSTDDASRLHHVLQGANRLGPSAGLETAVRIHHQVLDRYALQKALELLDDKLDGRDDGGMDVVGSWAKTLGVAYLLKG